MIHRIIQIRKDNGLNQEQFAKKLGLSRNFINQVENGKNNFSDRTISDICREFSVNETWLRTGEGEMFTKKDRESEITLMVQKLLSGESSDFKTRFISVLAGMKEEQWLVLEEKMNEIIGSRTDLSTESQHQSTLAPNIAQELAELRRQNQEILAQNRELMERLEAIEKEDEINGLGGGIAGKDIG